MGTIERVDAIMVRYNADQEEYRRQLLEAAIETGARLRHVLVPILHRWGMGMDRGGSLYYKYPNGESGCVEMDREYDYALQSVIGDALWAETGLEDGDTIHNYVGYIPLPKGQECKREYVWIVYDGDEEPHALSLDDCKDKTIAELSGRTYHGPVSLAYYEDMLLNEDPLSFIDVLPKYRVCVSNKCKWVRVGKSSGKVPAPDVPMQCTTGGFTLHYSNEHPAIKDCYVDDAARDLAYQDVKTSTGLVVEAALCYIMEGVLKDVTITVEGRPLTINPDHGIVTDIARFPSGDYSKRLMLAMISKYKKPV